MPLLNSAAEISASWQHSPQTPVVGIHGPEELIHMGGRQILHAAQLSPILEVAA
jgi:hypothetical protein